MSEFKEYVVTVKNKSDVDSFYDDMESENGNDYVPKRKVEIAQLREISRNTHYYLTYEEAQNLKNDNRILDVQPLPSSLGIEPGIGFPVDAKELWKQTSDFEKSTSISSTDKNWGLERVTRGSTIDGWGNSTSTYWNGVSLGSFTKTNQTVTTTSSGKNVDIILVDTIPNLNHPEFAVNIDGTGGSRFVSYNWFQHSDSLGINTTGDYQYWFGGDHGTHTTGIAAGNTQGWARDANIYNIDFSYNTHINTTNVPAGDWYLYIYDYIRAFHANKPINNSTGRKNPTIVNNSWGFFSNVSITGLLSVTYRGTTTSLIGKTDGEKKIILEQQCGVNMSSPSTLQMNYIYSGMGADVEDLIDDGIIFVTASGNSYAKMVKPADLDYNNSVSSATETYYFCRGGSPTSDGTAICVGATAATRWDMKASFSHYGSRVDIYAPGFNIVSSVYNGFFSEIPDTRNSNYFINSYSGTSMACPQVVGVLACILEQWPSLTQAEALQYLIDTSTKDQLLDPGVMYPDVTLTPGFYNGLGETGTNSNNRYLYYKKERQLEGNISKNTYKFRPSSGNSYPRQQIRKYG